VRRQVLGDAALQNETPERAVDEYGHARALLAREPPAAQASELISRAGGGGAGQAPTEGANPFAVNLHLDAGLMGGDSDSAITETSNALWRSPRASSWRSAPANTAKLGQPADIQEGIAARPPVLEDCLKGEDNTG